MGEVIRRWVEPGCYSIAGPPPGIVPFPALQRPRQACRPARWQPGRGHRAGSTTTGRETRRRPASAPTAQYNLGMTERATRPWFDVAFTASPVAMLLVDASAEIRTVNAAVGRMFGWHEHELIGCPVDVLVAASARRKFDKLRERLARPGRPRPRRTEIELRGQHRDGREFPIAVTIVLSQEGDATALVSVHDLSRRKGIEARVRRQNAALRHAVSDRTAELEATNARLQAEIEERRRTERKLRQAQQRLQEMNEELRRLAMVDGLTGLPNRRHFDARFEVEFQRAARARAPLAVVMLDLDDFKAFNDHAGHQAGDDCLRRVADAVANCLRRPADLAARWGGEEIVALLPDTPREGAVQIARAMRQAVRALGIPHPTASTGVVTLSAGVACLGRTPFASARHLLEAADRALYSAKARGRDRVCIAEASPDRPMPQSMPKPMPQSMATHDGNDRPEPAHE
ncbi:MAG: diguanylate cyclase [Planctomycetota bacterium]